MTTTNATAHYVAATASCAGRGTLAALQAPGTEPWQLPNGAHAVYTVGTEDPWNGGCYVLAEYVGPHPWVTWRMDPVTGACEHGHYHQDLNKAVADLLERAGR